MTDLNDIIDYYGNLLIIQYHNQPNARATIELMIKEILANGILFDVRDGYDLNTAVGHQLDILGKYIGIDRFYEQEQLDGFFAFTNYNEVSIPAGKRGFEDYATFPSSAGHWLTYDDVLGTQFSLDDESYRTILKMKIIQNNSNHSHASIDNDIFQFFGDTLFPDSPGNMIINYFGPSTQTQLIQVSIQKHVLPRPMGVRFGYYIPYDEIPYFAFTTYDGAAPTFGTGFTDYTDFGTKPGLTLDYDDLLLG